tara:strand:+ start:94 stop:963 length:870 start_codon:yes stop_codon:yes gene_type:complete
MGQYFYKSVKQEWDEQLFLYKRDFYSKKDCLDMKTIVQHIEQHPLFIKSMGLNNSTVNNKTRTQGVFYSESHLAREKKTYEKINNYFQYCSQLLFPVIIPPIYDLVKEIFGDWRVVRATIMYTEKGCPEQEVHHDNNEGDNIFFLSIPLHPTPIEQGPTIFYDDSIVGKYRVTLTKKELKEMSSYNNIGYFKNFKDQKKKDFALARKQYSQNLGDFSIHRDITFHSGGANTTNYTRKFLFLTCGLPNVGWNDYYQYHKDYGIQLVNSIQILGEEPLPPMKTGNFKDEDL